MQNVVGLGLKEVYDYNNNNNTIGNSIRKLMGIEFVPQDYIIDVFNISKIVLIYI